MSQKDQPDGVDSSWFLGVNPYREALRGVVEARYRRHEPPQSRDGNSSTRGAEQATSIQQAVEEALSEVALPDFPDPEETLAVWRNTVSADRATRFYGCSGVKFTDNFGHEHGANPSLWWLKGYTQIASGDVTITVDSHGDPFFAPEPEFAAYSIDCWFKVSVPTDGYYEFAAVVPVDNRSNRSIWKVAYEVSQPSPTAAAEWGAKFAVSVVQFDAAGKAIRRYPDIVYSAEPHLVAPKRLGSGVAYFADAGPQAEAWSASVGKVFLSSSAATTLAYVHCRYRQVIEKYGQGAIWYRTCIRNPTVGVTGPV